jgi:hypothetical protein
MTISFDGTNRIVTLAPGVSQVSADFIYSRWKDWVMDHSNARFLPAFRVAGGDPLTPGINAGTYFFVRNDLGWRIKPPEENLTIFVQGNIAPEDSDTDIMLPTDGDFSTAIFGLQPITQNVNQLFELQKTSDYMGMVSVDFSTGVAGDRHPVGTPSVPVNNLIDAFTLAEHLNLREFKLHADVVLDRNMTHFKVIGTASHASIDVNGFDISATDFSDLTVSGAIGAPTNGPPSFKDCRVQDTQGTWGLYRDCTFSSVGSIVLAPGFIALNSCNSDAGWNQATIIDFANNPTTARAADFRGGTLEIRNMTHPAANLTLNMNLARVVLHESCTGGIIFVDGVGSLIDNSAGSTVLRDTLLETDVTKVSVANILKRSALISAGL